MTIRKKYIKSFFAVLILLAALLFTLVPLTQAAPMELSGEEPSRYHSLKAKIAYLEMWLEALQDGELTPRPTFIVVLSGNEVSVFGTITRDPNSNLLETCGPMSKGKIDWGDGTIEDIVGLGCSGDVQEFSVAHPYPESDSYKIRVTDGQGRDGTHVVAVRVPN